MRLKPAVLAIFALSFIWGYNWVVMKECLQYAGPYDFAALRTGIGSLSMFALLILMRRPLRPQAFWPTALLGVTATTFCIGLVTLALATGGVGKTAILVYAMPFWVLLFAWPLLAEHIRGLQWVPIVLAFLGLMIILEPWRLEGAFISNIFAVLSGVAWALSSIMTKLMNRKYTFDLISLTAWQMFLGAIPLALIALFISDTPVRWTPYFTIGLLYSAIISHGLALVLWFFILSKLPAGIAGMGTLATPVIGMIAASIELGERPTMIEATGMLLIMSALALLSLIGYIQQRRIQSVIKIHENKLTGGK